MMQLEPQLIWERTQALFPHRTLQRMLRFVEVGHGHDAVLAGDCPQRDARWIAS